MCEKMSCVSHLSQASDQASQANCQQMASEQQMKREQLIKREQQHNKEHRVKVDTDDSSDVDMQIKGSTTTLLTAENTNINVKEEIDIQNDGSNFNENLIEEADVLDDTYHKSTSVNTTPEKMVDIHTVKRGPKTTVTFDSVPAAKAPKASVSIDSGYPTLMSFLAKPNMTEQDTSNAQDLAKLNSNTTTSDTSGSVDNGSINQGVCIRCEDCETNFTNKISFENHVFSEKCKWVCRYCKKEFVYSNYKASNKVYLYSLYKEKLQRHKKECDRYCRLCGYTCPQRDYLPTHMEACHAISKSQKFACDVCFMTFKSEINMYTHKVNKHTDNKGGMYLCPLCPKEYSSLANIATHLRLAHLGEKRPEIACSVCGKICNNTTIKRHENTHKVKTIKCDKCPTVFSTERNLIEHQRRHDKDYSHFCEVCGKGFYTTTTLENHRRIHTGEKPFSCSRCEYVCNVKQNLDKHMKIHERQSR